jgi:hypothetical protein
MRSRSIALLVTAAACGGEAPCPAAGPPATAGSEVVTEPVADDTPSIVLNVEQGSLIDMTRLLAHITGWMVAFDTHALGAAHCATIDIASPGRITVDQAVAAFERAIAPGLRVERRDGLLLVRRGEGAIAGCPHTEAAIAEPPPAGPDVEDDAAILGGIRALSETRYAVDRAALNRLLEGQSHAMGTIRPIPREGGGRVVGVLLYVITGSADD